MGSTAIPPRSVWTYLVGRFSGPRRMIVRPDEDGCDDIRADQIVMPRISPIQRLMLNIHDNLYCVYFDPQHHERDRVKASYVFVRMLNKKKAINMCPEDALPDLMHLLQMYVFNPEIHSL